MADSNDTSIAAVMEQLIAEGPDGMAQVFTTLFNLAMRFERERYLGAGHYERSPERRGYANGTKPKTIDTPVGTLTVDVPKTAGTPEPFYPASLERGRRSSRAVLLAVAEMYVKGVSTRDVEAVMAEFGIQSLSSTQVSRAAKLLDGELDAWRNRRSEPSATSSSTLATRRSARAASSPMPPCSQPSASTKRDAAASSASPPSPRRPRSIGEPSSTASSRAACAE
jgi:hypothetical protein